MRDVVKRLGSALDDVAMRRPVSPAGCAGVGGNAGGGAPPCTSKPIEGASADAFHASAVFAITVNEEAASSAIAGPFLVDDGQRYVLDLTNPLAQPKRAWKGARARPVARPAAPAQADPATPWPKRWAAALPVPGAWLAARRRRFGSIGRRPRRAARPTTFEARRLAGKPVARHRARRCCASAPRAVPHHGASVVNQP